MLLAVLALTFGLVLLVWSASRFVDGAAAAQHFGMPPLLIGMLVVGIAVLIEPMTVDSIIFSRDWSLMFALTLVLLVLGIGFKKQGRINRLEGALLLAIFCGYSGYLVSSVF